MTPLAIVLTAAVVLSLGVMLAVTLLDWLAGWLHRRHARRRGRLG